MQRAEDRGFEFAWFSDHYFFRDVYAGQAFVAERTTRIKLGTAVTSPFLRHPSLLAASLASLAELADGRVVFGVGPGGHEFPTELCLPMDKPLTAVREAVHIVKGLLTGERFDYSGKIFGVSHARLPFVPSLPIPTYLAARGEKMARLAGELADGLITHGVRPRHLQAVAEWARQGAEAAGRQPSSIDVAFRSSMAITSDPGAARDGLRQDCMIQAGGEYAENMVHLLGLDPARMASLRAAVRTADWQTAAGLMDEDIVDAYCLVGPSGVIRERLHEAEELGVGQYIAHLGHRKSDEEAIAFIDQIGEQILACY